MKAREGMRRQIKREDGQENIMGCKLQEKRKMVSDTVSACNTIIWYTSHKTN